MLIGLVIVSMLAMAGLVGVILLNPRQVQVAVQPTSTTTPTVTLTFTRIPVITAVPPSATPTQTPSPTPTSTATPIPPTSTPVPPTPTLKPTRRFVPTSTSSQCVDVVGDSVAHGDAVFEIPQTGYAKAQLAPISAYMQYQYGQRGLKNVKVLNRSVSATGISAGNYPSYFGTVEYATLLQDKCRYVVIIPWINDLSSGIDAGTAAGNHVAALGRLVQALVQADSGGKILVVNYYQGSAAPFALGSFASGFTPGNIAAFNQQIAAACAGGALALGQVACVDSNAALGGLGLAQVIGPTSLQDLQNGLAVPLSPDEQNMVNFYFSAHPDGMLVGDGVHLSGVGKAALANYLVQITAGGF